MPFRLGPARDYRDLGTGLAHRPRIEVHALRIVIDPQDAHAGEKLLVGRASGDRRHDVRRVGDRPLVRERFGAPGEWLLPQPLNQVLRLRQLQQVVDQRGEAAVGGQGGEPAGQMGLQVCEGVCPARRIVPVRRPEVVLREEARDVRFA